MGNICLPAVNDDIRTAVEQKMEPNVQQTEPQTVPSIEDWTNFAATLKKGRVLLPLGTDLQEFNTASRNFWQFANDIIPAVIIICKCEDDVVKSMKFLSLPQHQTLTFRVKCGGHSYGGYNKNSGGVMVDISNMKNIDISTYVTTGIISAEPGVRGTDFVDFMLTQKAQIRNSILLPIGGCSIVAFGGYITGGGISYLSRYLGLGCDYCIGARIVLSDGTVLDIKDTDTEHADLLWAIKGSGGGNFGVITKYYFKPFDNGEKNGRAFSISYSIDGEKENIRQFLKGFSILLNELPENVGFIPEISQESLKISGIITDINDKTDITDAIITQINKTIGLQPTKTDTYPKKSTGKVWKIYQKYVYPVLVPIAPKSDKKHDMDAKEMVDENDNVEYDNVQCLESFLSKSNYKPFKSQLQLERKENNNEQENDGWHAYDTSRLLVNLDDTTINIITDIFWSVSVEFSKTEKYLTMGIGFEAMGGKIKSNDPQNKTTSFQNRDALATFICGFSWLNNASKGAAFKYTKYFQDNVFKKISNVKYVNYMENICGDSTLQQYYPNKQLFTKAQQIKSKYDPNNRFRFEFSIPPL